MKMKNIRIASFMILAFFLMSGNNALMADPVSHSQALQVAQAFLREKGKTVQTIDMPRKGKSMAKQGNAAYYVFNNGDSDGFVIVSGDDRTEQILGYSMNGAFDEEDMPENVKAWLQTYADQIESMGNGPRRAPSHTYHDAIPVIIKTLWGQDTPYNNACPPYIIGGNTYSSVTGCVATAIAQIMYHYKYPTAVTTAIPAYSYEDQYGSHSVEELATTSFEWNKMKYDYDLTYTSEEAAAVATLMTYCGRSVGMMYSPGSSGASDVKLVGALSKYFGYDKSLQRLSRSQYSTYQWQEMIYGELSAGRPVFYSGDTDTGSGHAFICDGYNGEGKFHFNWGWNGRYNGYYALTALNPDPTHQEAGSGSGSTGYNYNQAIIVDIKPDQGGNAPQDLYLTAEPDDGGNYFSVSQTAISAIIFNLTGHTANFKAGCELIPETGDPIVIYGSNFPSLAPQMGSSGATLVNLGSVGDRVPDGRYKIIPISGTYSDTSNPDVTNYRPLIPNMYITAEVANHKFVNPTVVTDPEDNSQVDIPDDEDPILGPYPDEIDGTHLYCTQIGVQGNSTTWTSINLAAPNSYTMSLAILNDDRSLSVISGGYTKETPYDYKEAVGMGIDISGLPGGRTYKLVPVSRLAGDDPGDWKIDTTDGSYFFYDPGNGIFEVRVEEPTGINNLNDNVSANGNDNTIYDLSGRKIANGTSPNTHLPNGIYIHNGKKVVVR